MAARAGNPIPRAPMSGYVACGCRDCFDIAISPNGKPVLCSDCVAAGCHVHGTKLRALSTSHECQRSDAYGVGEESST